MTPLYLPGQSHPVGHNQGGLWDGLIMFTGFMCCMRQGLRVCSVVQSGFFCVLHELMFAAASHRAAGQRGMCSPH